MGNWSSNMKPLSSLQNRPQVVVVGGGFGGIEAAKILENRFNVVVLERKNFFFHVFGALRAAIDEKTSKLVALPYSNALKNGKVIQAEVEKITEDGIKVKGKDELVKYDYLVIATGSSYPFPSKTSTVDINDLPKIYAETREAIQKAKSITLVGGGVVGVELLGELSHYHPDKKYTLIHGSEDLTPGPYKKDFKDKFLKLVKETPNVELILNDKAILDDEAQKSQGYLEGRKVIKTQNGKKVEADLIFFCTGTKVNNSTFKESFPVDENGRIKVNQYLQVEGHQNVFAVGDCANFPEGKLGFLAQMQGATAANNIIALDEKKGMTPKNPLGPALVAPYGPFKGFVHLPFGGIILGPTFASNIKGKSLFLPFSYSLLNQKMPSS